jgi:hypothetical protein
MDGGNGENLANSADGGNYRVGFFPTRLMEPGREEKSDCGRWFAEGEPGVDSLRQTAEGSGLGAAGNHGGLQEFAEAHEIIVGPGNHMDGDDFTDGSGGGGTGFDGGFDGGDIATDEDGDMGGTDFFPANEFDIGCFEHCIGGLELSNETFGFNHT